MKKQFLVISVWISIILLLSCKNTSSDPQVDGNWSDGDSWHCLIEKQEGGIIVMYTQEGESIEFIKKSNEYYTARGGTVTMEFQDDPTGKSGNCPNRQKKHWYIKGLKERIIHLMRRQELC